MKSCPTTRSGCVSVPVSGMVMKGGLKSCSTWTSETTDAKESTSREPRLKAGEQRGEEPELPVQHQALLHAS